MSKSLTLLAVALTGLSLPASAQSFSRNPNPVRERTGQTRIVSDLLAVETISQSSATTVTTGASVSCNAGGLHADNSYYRGFTLSAFPALVLPQYVIQSVTIGVEVANASGTGTTQPLTLNTWKATANPIAGGANPPGDNQTSTDALQIADQTLSLQQLNIVTQPVYLVASEILAIEIFTPDGQTAGHSFFIGSNALGQSGPSYIKAASCGLATIGDLAGIGFPNMHIVMQVTGNNQTPVELQTFGIE